MPKPRYPKRKRCKHCGAGFQARRPTAKFCSWACRQAAYRKRRDRKRRRTK